MQAQILLAPLAIFFFFFLLFLSSYFFSFGLFPFILIAGPFLLREIFAITFFGLGSFFCPKQGQRSKLSAAHLYPNIGQLVDTTAAPALSISGR